MADAVDASQRFDFFGFFSKTFYPWGTAKMKVNQMIQIIYTGAPKAGVPMARFLLIHTRANVLYAGPPSSETE